MKKLTDISIFRRHPFHFQREKEGCSYFARNNQEWTCPTFLPQKPPDALFWCASIWESKMKSGCHMRRINSNFLALEHIQKGSLYVRQDDGRQNASIMQEVFQQSWKKLKNTFIWM